MRTKQLIIEIMRDYLETHNDPTALEGYFNDIAEEINPDLINMGISPITIVDPESYETGS